MSDGLITPTDTIRRLHRALQKKLTSLTSSTTRSRLYRASIQVEGFDLISWLNSQTVSTRIFWARRDEPLRIAAIGAVHHLVGNSLDILRSIHSRLEDAESAIRYYGGMRFDPEQEPEEMWRPFAKYHFVLPQFEITQEDNRQHLSINFSVQPGDDLLQVYAHCRHQLARLAPMMPMSTERLPAVIRCDELPNQEEWMSLIQNALMAIERKEFEKIVLAGRTTLHFDQKLNPWQLLNSILMKNGRSFHFSFQFQEDAAFIGMTPECLFKRQGDLIFTEAVASTRQRGTTIEEDEALGAEMTASDKDQREHRWVKRMILDRLTPLCTEINVINNEILLKLTHVQHLLSEMKGELREDIYNEQIISSLHPTPAVGGYPKKAAVKHIARLEPMDRGWYAAPVGWISKNEAEFAVAIRSALINKNLLHVYAGSGIVHGSDAQKEWDENRNKAKNFMQLFEP